MSLLRPVPKPNLGQSADIVTCTHSLVRAVLDESLPLTAFREEIEPLLERWLEPEGSCSGLARLPALVCEAHGGNRYAALPLSAAWQLVRLAAKLLDDVEDGEITSRRGATVNIATALLFTAHLVLNRLAVPAKRVGDELQLAMLRAAGGQHTDLQMQRSDITALDPDSWLAIARAKSGELFGWATWAGAYVAAGTEAALDAYREYGACLGVLLQVADDFNGIWRPDGASDLAVGRVSLPICYARLVAQGQAREDLSRILYAAAEGVPDAEREGQQALTDLGAQDYLTVPARSQRWLARQALKRAGCRSPGRDRLVALLDGVLKLQKSYLGD